MAKNILAFTLRLNSTSNQNYNQQRDLAKLGPSFAYCGIGLDAVKIGLNFLKTAGALGNELNFPMGTG